jgi:hypothetical protein
MWQDPDIQYKEFGTEQMAVYYGSQVRETSAVTTR